jgi:tetratricopeptide (TPR) repeat protein
VRTGDLVAAAAYVERAAATFQVIGDIMGANGVVGLRGDLARALGDLPAARQAYQALLDRDVALANPTRAISLHNGLADLALMESNWDRVKHELDTARGIARARGLTGWDQGLDYWYGELALLRGDLDEAERLLIAQLQRSLLPYRRYARQSRLAEVSARRGDVVAAESRLSAAMDTLDRWRAAQSDRDLRLAVSGFRNLGRPIWG